MSEDGIWTAHLCHSLHHQLSFNTCKKYGTQWVIVDKGRLTLSFSMRLVIALSAKSALIPSFDRYCADVMAENGEVSPENGEEETDDVLQKLQKDCRDMKESLRLERSRNAGPEGECLLCYVLCIR